MIKEINKISEKITKSIKKSITKRNEYILFLTLTAIIIIWLAYYIIPETLASLFNTILGKIILILIIFIISYYDVKYGILFFIFIIIIYRFTTLFSKNTTTITNNTNNKNIKEGFIWSQDTLQKFLKVENTINKGIVFDTNVTQKQATEKEAQYFLKHGMWPWDEEVKILYMKSVKNNPYIRTSPKDSMNYARTIYNQAAILQVLSLQENEGKLLIDGVLIDASNNQMEPPYAYTSGLISKYNSIIRCNTKDKNNAIMEKKTMEPNGSLNAPTVTLIDYHNLENEIPGFKFINKPCNPCLALNNHPDYSCPFSIKTSNNPYGDISGVWQLLWNITPTHYPLKSEPTTVASTIYEDKNKFPLLKNAQENPRQMPNQTDMHYSNQKNIISTLHKK